MTPKTLFSWRLALVCAFALGALTCWWWRALPQPLFAEPLSTILLARDGALLGASIANDGQWRFPPGDQVPDKFRRALIVYEDKHFYEHPGIDVAAAIRAAYLNLKHRRIVS